jgi:hypothetical protein
MSPSSLRAQQLESRRRHQIDDDYTVKPHQVDDARPWNAFSSAVVCSKGRRRAGPTEPPRFAAATGVVTRPNCRACTLPRAPGYSGKGNFFWADRAASFLVLPPTLAEKKLQAAFSGRAPANKETRRSSLRFDFRFLY